MVKNAPDWRTCGATIRDEGDKWVCEGCLLVMRECVCAGAAKHTRKDSQLQHHDEPISVTSNVRELVRNHALSSLKYSDATSQLTHELENIIKDQEAEIRRLSDEQIKPLADYLLSIGGPDRDESACEMAVRLLKGFGDNADPSA